MQKENRRQIEKLKIWEQLSEQQKERAVTLLAQMILRELRQEVQEGEKWARVKG